MTNALPAEFVGGPKDGEILMIEPDQDGLPLEHVRVAVSPDLPALLREALDERLEPTEISYQVLIYRRDVISDRTHRWRYLLT